MVINKVAEVKMSIMFKISRLKKSPGMHDKTALEKLKLNDIDIFKLSTEKKNQRNHRQKSYDHMTSFGITCVAMLELCQVCHFLHNSLHIPPEFQKNRNCFSEGMAFSLCKLLFPTLTHQSILEQFLISRCW